MKKYKPDKFFINIPFDDNRNYISDAWEYDEGKDPKEDEDDDPHSDIYKGDGLSRYDEYRGFFTQEGYIRTNPNHKDVFVYDYSGKLETGYFSQTNLAIHLNPFLENDDKKVTRYDTTAHLPYNQYWIQLKAVWDEIFDPDGKPTSGHCEGYLGKNVSPECKIDLKHLNDLYPNDPNAKPWIIAHELGHAVTFDYRECTNPSCIMNQVIPATTYCSNCRELIHLHP